MSRNGLPNSNPHFPDTPLGSFFMDYLWDTNMHASKPMIDYGKIFLAMFTQTELHLTMKGEIQRNSGNSIRGLRPMIENG